ncbi:RlmE family RNA methyltransferase [Variovorax sp. V512]
MASRPHQRPLREARDQRGLPRPRAYKLKEIDESLGLVKPGQLVVDLGSTPGAWSQYLRRRMSPGGAAVGDLNGTIISLDLLPMEPIEGVTFLQGDFREDALLAQLLAVLDGRKADLVVSDMAPNLSGIHSADAARVEHLIELAIELRPAPHEARRGMVAKVFHGSGYDELVKMFKAHFRVVSRSSPRQSRDKSAETFLIGRGLKALDTH